jgi:hypothetical protein
MDKFLLPLPPHNARRVGLCHFLARPKKWRKKGAKGPDALWKPAVRKGRGAVALLIFSQKQTVSTLAFAS